MKDGAEQTDVPPRVKFTAFFLKVVPFKMVFTQATVRLWEDVS